jgi:hypothetical protein
MDHTVTFRVGRADYIAMLRAGRSLGVFGRFGNWVRGVVYGLFFVALINLIYILSESFDPVTDFLSSVIAFVIIVLAAPVGRWLGDHILSRRIFPRFAVANKDLTITFADDGIRTQHSGIEGKFPWSTVTRILETKNYLFLLISRAETIMVARRALSSPDAAAELATYIRSKVVTTPAG